MSDIPDGPPLDMREQIARIDRNIAETQKLLAGAGRFNRDIWIVPLGLIGAIVAGALARLPEILHAFGVS